MHRLVESPPLDLPLDAWFPLYRLTVEFEPDLIVELGRGWGNSTCVFTEAANEIGARVVSVGFDSEHAWETRTAPRLLAEIGEQWFAVLSILQADITETDFRPILAGSERTLVFWDAHGQDVAAAVLHNLMPLLPRANLIVVDDVWSRNSTPPLRADHVAGPFASPFDEIEPLWDYLQGHRQAFEQGERWVSFNRPDPK